MTVKIKKMTFPSLLMLLVFLTMELPIRLWVQPDPWLLHPDHWYFQQPMRLVIEAVLVCFLVLLLAKTARSILVIPKQHRLLLLLSVFASTALFASLEWQQLLASLDAEPSDWLMWLLTGLMIGVGQELLYRGLLFTSLARYLSVTTAAWLTTLAFVIAPLHSVRLWDYWQQGAVNVVLLLVGIYVAVSVFFQWLRNKSQSVVIPAIVHGVGNGVTWVAVFS